MAKHSLGWIIVFVLAFLATPAMFTQKMILSAMEYEHQQISEFFGEEKWESIFKKAASSYSHLPSLPDRRPSGVDGGSASQKIDILARKSLNDLAHPMRSYKDNIGLCIFQFLVRLQITFIWMIYIAPFLVAAIVDGAMQRNAKVVSFQHTNPIRYNAAAHSIIPALFAPFIYLLMPFPMSPMLFAIWAVFMAFGLRALISNMLPMSRS